MFFVWIEKEKTYATSLENQIKFAKNIIIIYLFIYL